jgi:hypothetical protein
LLGRRGEREPELRNGAPQIATPPSSTAPELRGAQDGFREPRGIAKKAAASRRKRRAFEESGGIAKKAARFRKERRAFCRKSAPFRGKRRDPEEAPDAGFFHATSQQEPRQSEYLWRSHQGGARVA